MEKAAASVAERVGNAISTFTFDYSTWASYWASNDHIAPCLADYLHRVSDAYRDVGGDGRIAYVSHSMGGLAIRYAMDGDKVANPVDRSQVPWIITVDTPHLGSPWGGLGPAQAKELWDGVTRDSAPNPFGVDGGRCLALHDRGSTLPASCNGLPPWLAGGTTLYQVAGSITIRRTFLGVHLYDIPLSSDGIVDVPSERGYLTSGPGGTAPLVSSPSTGTTVHSQYVDCEVSSGELGRAIDSLKGVLNSVGVPVQLLGDWEALRRLGNGGHDPLTLGLDAAAFLVADCSHTTVMDNPDTLDLIAQDLREILAAAPPSVPDVLPGLPATATSAAALKTFLRSGITGLDPIVGSPGQYDRCQAVEVLGADLARGALDMTFLLSTGGKCGGDAASVDYKIRDRTVVMRRTVCGDCVGVETPDPGISASYGNRVSTSFTVAASGNDWTLILGGLRG